MVPLSCLQPTCSSTVLAMDVVLFSKSTEHRIVILCRRMTGMALLRGFCGQDSFRLTVPFEFLEAPAAGSGESFAVFFHHVDKPPRSLDGGPRSLPRLEHIKNQHRAVRKFSGGVALDRFFIRIDVVQPTDPFKERALWANQEAIPDFQAARVSAGAFDNGSQNLRSEAQHQGGVLVLVLPPAAHSQGDDVHISRERPFRDGFLRRGGKPRLPRAPRER